MTSKGNCHIELKEIVTRKWVKDRSLTVSHINGKSNPADIFTKEMRNGTNFCCIHDAFISRSSNFLKGLFVSLSEYNTSIPQHVAQVAHFIPPAQPGLPNVLISHSLFYTHTAISCLLNARQHILSRVSHLSRTL
jgi:hypothetical protein